MTSREMHWCLAAMLATALAPHLREARADDDRGQRIAIRSLSTRPDRVSGGDVLLEISLPSAPRKGDVIVSLNGRVVTDAFHQTAPGTLVGLVSGLALGDNRLTAEAKGLGTGSLRLTNYPITGPIVSGPHLQPFICQTETFVLPDGTKLGPSLDPDCSAATKVTYVYMAKGATAFKALPSATALPADVSMTTTSSGATVPFVVRVETGTMNRGIYQNSILFNPTTDAAPSPFSAPKGWNRRLIAVHGSGCPGGWYIQGPVEGASVLESSRLAEGYAMFTNTLNHPTNSCNAFLAGETTMMGKEHFIETFGVPEFTVSTGGSGGAYTSLQVGDAFPGLFDGVLISATFPDALSIALAGLDGHLMTHYFLTTNTTGFSDAQKVAATGYKGLQAWYDAANQMGRTDPVPGRVDPTPPSPILGRYNSAVWNPAVPLALRYHPVTNPTGARPTVFDVARNIYGRDPVTGFGLRAFDNIGVQYGLAALNAGVISFEQFADLNERIGGYDSDANFVSPRTTGNPGAIRRAYQSGVALGGGGGLASIPVFDTSGLFDDDQLYHYQHHHFAVRERMLQANGSTGNHVMWRGGLNIFETLGKPSAAGAALASAVATQSWKSFIQWVAAMKADASDAPDRVKVIRSRPAGLTDGCWTFDVNPQFIAERQTWSSQPDSQCNGLWPSYSFPRKVAGGPLAENVLKCRLKSIDHRDYAVALTPAQLARLHAAFPNGVCDWSRRGVNQTGVRTWASFGPSPNNLIFDVTNPDRPDHDDEDD